MKPAALKITFIGLGVAAALAAATPAVAGLAGNSALSKQVDVKVAPSPSSTHAEDTGRPIPLRSSTHPEPSGSTHHTEPGDDRGGATRHAEPGDDHGGATRHAEPGDDHGGDRGGSDDNSGHGGGNSGRG